MSPNQAYCNFSNKKFDALFSNAIMNLSWNTYGRLNTTNIQRTYLWLWCQECESTCYIIMLSSNYSKKACFRMFDISVLMLSHSM